jgi:hypothetical protein
MHFFMASSVQNLREVGGTKAVLMAGGERAQQDWQREVCFVL